jgi:hypothetical protein
MLAGDALTDNPESEILGISICAMNSSKPSILAVSISNVSGSFPPMVVAAVNVVSHGLAIITAGKERKVYSTLRCPTFRTTSDTHDHRRVKPGR